MTTPLRSIAPAPSIKKQGPQRDPPGEGTRALRRKPLVSAACRPCQRRKTKCDGERPTCAACGLTQLDCEWDTEPGLTRGASLRVRNAKLESALSTMLEAFWYLQTKPLDEAREVLDQIRASSDLSSVLEYLNMQKVTSQTNAHGQMAWQALGLAQQQPVPALAERGVNITEGPSDMSVSSKTSGRSSHDEDTPKGQPIFLGYNAFLEVFAHQNTMLGLRSGINAFNAYTAVVFHVFDVGELEQLEREVLDGFSTQGPDWILKSPESDAVRKRSMLAEVCAAAALGLQYHDEPFHNDPSIPPNTTGSISDADELSRMFYRIAKSFLDDATEFSPYRALKLCALFGIYNVMEHSSVALAYTDLGLTFALDYGLFGVTPPPGMSMEDFINNRKTLRTLATLRNWLTATLGYVPGTGIDLCVTDIYIAGENDNNSVENIIQRKMMEATTVASNLVRTASSFSILSPPVLRDINLDLGRWDEGMVEELQVESMMRRPSPLPAWFHAGLQMHLLHSSTSVMKARTVHANQRSSPTTFAQTEMRVAVIEGIEAAQSSARIFERMLDENIIFRKSWMCISSAFCSGTTLLWCSSQAMIFSQPPEIWQQDLKSASICLRLLDHCAPRHKVAALFHQTLQPYFAIIQEAATTLIDDDAMDTIPLEPRRRMSASTEYLFAQSTGQSPLNKANYALHNIIGRPFGSAPQDSLPHPTMRAADASTTDARLSWTKYVTSVFNGQVRQQLHGDDPQDRVLRESLEMIGAGHFIDSREPHGWSGIGD